MKYNIIKLNEDITKAKGKLNRLIENQVEYNEIYEQSVVTDKVIAKYLKVKEYLEKERKRIMKDYSKLLDSPFQLEITSEIEKEIKEDFPKVKEKELNHFSNNVYIYSILRAYNINEQDIVDQLVYLNNRYFDEMQEDERVKDSKIKCTNIEYLKNLINKYMKKIKEKM